MKKLLEKLLSRVSESFVPDVGHVKLDQKEVDQALRGFERHWPEKKVVTMVRGNDTLH